MSIPSTVRSEPAATQRRRFRLTEGQFGLLLILPSAVMIFGLLGYPLLYSLSLMFLDLNITRPWLGTQFVGLDNFIQMATDQTFRDSLWRTCYFAFFNIVMGVPVALLFAILLNQKFPLRGLARGAMLIPWAIPGVVNGLIWARIYDANYGNLNSILYQFGIIHDYIPWLNKPEMALFLVTIAEVWIGTPALTLIYLAGLQTISHEVYEAASVDGAGIWQTFRYITLPLLKPTTMVVIVLKTISAFSVFDLIFVLTGGGPASSTQVLSYFIYLQSFKALNYGYSAALSYLVAFIILALVIIYARLIKVEGTQ